VLAAAALSHLSGRILAGGPAYFEQSRRTRSSGTPRSRDNLSEKGTPYARREGGVLHANHTREPMNWLALKPPMTVEPRRKGAGGRK
jgi:hypothetical protein